MLRFTFQDIIYFNNYRVNREQRKTSLRIIGRNCGSRN